MATRFFSSDAKYNCRVNLQTDAVEGFKRRYDQTRNGWMGCKKAYSFRFFALNIYKIQVVFTHYG